MQINHYEPGFIVFGPLTGDVFNKRPGRIHIVDHEPLLETHVFSVCGMPLDLLAHHSLFRKMEIEPAPEDVCKRCSRIWRRLEQMELVVREVQP